MAQNADDLVREAEERLVQGDLAKAAELFMAAHEEEAKSRRKSPAGAIGVARVALMLGQTEDAQIALDKVLATFPDHAEALTYRGVVEEAKGNLEEALRYYQRGAKLDPKFPVARFNLGRVFGLQKRWKEAVRELQVAVRQSPDNRQYCYSLGIACQESGNTAQAIEAFSDCIEIDPLFLDGHVTLADVLVSARREELAMEILKNALGIFPKAGILYEKLAAILLRRGDPAGAGGFLRKQTEVEPRSVHAWLSLGVVALMVLDFETAEQAAVKATELDPGGWRGFLQLGMVYDACNLKDKAKEALKKAVQRGSDAWEPHNNLGTLLMEESTPAAWKEAARLLERAVQLGPTRDPHVPLYNLALIYWKLGDMAKSRSYAEAAAQQGPPGDSVTADAKRFLGNFD
jgi:tetratricopeptide (TPR) repeat protein